MRLDSVDAGFLVRLALSGVRVAVVRAFTKRLGYHMPREVIERSVAGVDAVERRPNAIAVVYTNSGIPDRYGHYEGADKLWEKVEADISDKLHFPVYFESENPEVFVLYISRPTGGDSLEIRLP